MVKRFIKNNWQILFITILASILRFLWLDKIPTAIGGDELIYFVTSKSILLSGHDLSGVWNPLSVFLFNYPPNQMQAELPYFLIFPIIKLLPFSLLSARLVYSIMSIFIVLIIYLISKQLFNKNVAFFAGFIAAINPWFIYIGRTSYEMVPATLFYLVGIYLFLIKSPKKIFLGFLFFVLGFYSYIGTKIIFLPLIFLTVIYSYYFVNKKTNLRNYLIIIFLSFVLVLFFTFAIKNNSNSRMGEIISINDPVISKQVDYLRKNSIHNPLTNVFESKPAVLLNIMANKFVNTLSFNYLFAKGDDFYSNLNHGLFYFIDFLFLVLGIGFSFIRQKKAALFLLFMSAVSVLPHVLHGIKLDNFTPHITLLFPFLIIFIGVGIWEIVSLFKSRRSLIISLVIIIMLYIISLLNFLNIYFYQFPMNGYFNFPVRIVSKYISETNQKVIVYSPRSYDLFTKYLFYANRLNDKNFSTIKNDVEKKSFKLENVEFKSCDNTLDFSKTKETIIYDFDCGALPKDFKHLAIARLTDGGQIYEIFNDQICKNFNLKNYPAGIKINDFSIESQSIEKFCQTYIVEP